MCVGYTAFTACNEDDDSVDYTEYYDWRDANTGLMEFVHGLQKDDSAQTYFNQKIQSMKEPAWYTYYHIVHAANVDSLASLTPRKDFHPYSTSTLSVHYTLYDTHSVLDKLEALGCSQQTLRNTAAMDSIFFANADGNTLKADTLESQQVAFFDNFTPNDVIVGWGDILQQMYIGDHVVAMIPWFLGYGQKGSLPSIDPYSNLFFRIELCDITRLGATVE